MRGLVNQAGGLKNFFGDGSDGAFNPATILAAASAPNGGTVANLWDMNAGTVFTTGSLTSASDCVVLQIDFGVPFSITAALGAGFYSYQTAISTGVARNLNVEYSNDGVAWSLYQGAASNVTTSAGNWSWASSSNPIIARYFRWVLRAGGSTCTLTMQGMIVNFITGDTQTTKACNIIYPSTLNGPAVVKQFSSLTLPVGYSMTVENPCQGLIIYCQGNAVINGTIDMSKKAGLAPNGNIIPMPITKKAQKTSKTSSLLHFDNNVTDANGRTWTNNGAATFDATNKKFGSHAISFNGTNQWIDTPASDYFSFGQDDFTIDFWERHTTTGTNMNIYGSYNSSANSDSLGIMKLNNERLYVSITAEGSTSVTYGIYSSVGVTVPANQFNHIAVCRNGQNILLFLNGVGVGTFDLLGTNIAGVRNKVAVGRNGEYAANYFSGQIDEFRIVKGKAMYTANFTPPTAEYNYTATYTETPKTMEKYLQLTSVLQPLRGGYGGNGGYGGGYTSTLGSSVGGYGGSGRQNLGGFGGGGGGGNGGYSGAAYIGGNGGSIEATEMGGGQFFSGTASTNYNQPPQPVSAGAGGVGMVYNGSGGATGLTRANTGKCNGGGGGGSGGLGYSTANTQNAGNNGEYSGGFIGLLFNGTLSGSGVISANGGAGGAGSNAIGISTNYAGGGGGGGGSGGGVIMQIYSGVDSFTGTRTVNGGTGGAGGTGYSTGGVGGAGSSGSVGAIHIQAI